MIVMFHANVGTPRMHEKWNVHQVRTIAQLHWLADKCTWEDEGRRIPGELDVDADEAGASSSPRKKMN